MEPGGISEKLVSFADEIGLFYEDLGLPRAWGRVLGWLLVCEPDFQSTEDLATVLHASKSSINTTTQMLVRVGMVERQTIRGIRRTYYRIRPGAWTTIFEDQKQRITRLRQLAEQGLGLLNGEPAERWRRLEEMRELMAFYEREYPALKAHWDRDHQAEH